MFLLQDLLCFPGITFLEGPEDRKVREVAIYELYPLLVKDLRTLVLDCRLLLLHIEYNHCISFLERPEDQKAFQVMKLLYSSFPVLRSLTKKYAMNVLHMLAY